MNFKKVLLTGVMAASMIAAVACNNNKKRYDVTLWVSEIEGVAEMTKEQVARFAAQEGVTLNVTVEGVTEADSATKMLTDVEAGADIYCFAQDQFARLVQGGALSKLGVAAGAEVKANNDAGTVAAATSGSDLYAYPLTSDNGYFMYYDKSVITNEDHLKDVAALVADCEAAGKNFSMEFETSGWYLASWFFGMDEEGNRLCNSEWTTDDEGKFTAVRDTFNSDNGVIAAKGAQQLVKSANFISSSATGDLSADPASAILVSGTWAYSDVQKVLGDNMGVAELPCFTVGGKKYHMGSYSGCKLMGVKPTEDPERSAIMHKLARFLTNEECQLERFNSKGWGPSNLNAQASDAVKANPALVALGKQNNYSIPQGQIHGSWWDITKVLGSSIEKATNDEEIKAALKAYEDSIDAVLNMSDDEKNKMTAIGSFYGDGWTVDATMALDVTTNKWKTLLPIEMKAGVEFKVRQGKSWDVAYGTDGNNYVVEADGTYYVTLDVSSETPAVGLETVEGSGWSIVGKINGVDAWENDIELEGDGVVQTKEVTFAAGDKFKVRFDKKWDISFGNADGQDYAVETAGTYTVSFNRLTGEITLAAK